MHRIQSRSPNTSQLKGLGDQLTDLKSLHPVGISFFPYPVQQILSRRKSPDSSRFRIGIQQSKYKNL